MPVELCCVQLIIIAAALMELCCVQLISVGAALPGGGIVLCAVDCPTRDSGCSCLRYYKRRTAGRMASLKTPSTAPSSVVCARVSCVFCPICGVCPDEMCVLYCVCIVQRTGLKIGPK